MKSVDTFSNCAIVKFIWNVSTDDRAVQNWIPDVVARQQIEPLLYDV